MRRSSRTERAPRISADISFPSSSSAGGRNTRRKWCACAPSLLFTNIKSWRCLSPGSGGRLSLACPAHEGRFARRSEVEQSLRTGRTGASPKPADAASCASCLARMRPGGRGSSSAATTSGCHRMAGRGKRRTRRNPRDGERNLFRSRLCPEARSPVPEIAAMERRPAWSRPLVSAVSENTLRN